MKERKRLIRRLLVLVIAVQTVFLPFSANRVFAAESTAQEAAEETRPDREFADETESERESTGETAAEIGEPETVVEELLEEGETGENLVGSPEDLLDDYLNSRLYPERVKPAADTGKKKLRSATRPLEGLNADVYAAALTEIRKIADGETNSSVVTVYIGNMLDKKRFTAAELGVGTIYTVTTEEEESEDGSIVEKKVYQLSAEARQALYREIGWEARKVMNFLMTNCPYELYWYDKTVNYMHSITVSYRAPEEAVIIPDDARIRLYLPVSKDYAAQEADDPKYTTDTVKTSAASRAVGNAKEIVSRARDLTDWEKLTTYRDAIFDLVSYDHTAGAGESDYGDPWQIVHVFDGDSSTNVVCEGYAKAFQYLCDLTDWNREISCHTVTGTLGDSSLVKHMWNVVSLWDGCNFVVDLTNCDAGTEWYPDGLFMVGTDDFEDGTYTPQDGKMRYSCDPEMKDLYTEESIRITSHSAHDPHYYEGMTPEFIWSEDGQTCEVSVVCGLCGEKHFFDTEISSEAGPEEGQTKYTALFLAEDHEFTDSVIRQNEEKKDDEDPDDKDPDDEDPDDGKPDDQEKKDPPDDGRKDPEKDKDGDRDDTNKSDTGTPQVGDTNAESVRSLIGVILLCLAGIAAVILILRRNWDGIREICTDENGKFDPIGGLERHFVRSSDAEEEAGDDLSETVPDEKFMKLLHRQKGEGMEDMDLERDRIREHIIFHGRVQGVGFRYQAMYSARSFDLTGWVQNLPDGSVEMEVQGVPAGIGRMLKHLQSGHWIRIDRMEMEERPVDPNERGFRVKGY